MTSFGDDGFVYAIRAEHCDYVKFGWSTEPIRRVLSLQTGCPTPLRLVATARVPRAFEATVHRTFTGDEFRRVHGEWFDLGPISDVAITRVFELFERFVAAPTNAAKFAVVRDFEVAA